MGEYLGMDLASWVLLLPKLAIVWR